MVGLFIEQHFLPFYPQTYGECEKYRVSKLEAAAATSGCYKNGKFGEPKSKMSGFSGFLKSIKSEQGNASVAEVQDLMSSCKILSIKWKNTELCTIVMQDGTIIHIKIKNIYTNEYICEVDRFFRFAEPVGDVAYSDRHVLFLFGDNRLLIARKEYPANAKSEMIQPEVTVESYPEFLPSLVSRRCDKKLAINDRSNLFMVWWSGSKDDVFPWSPRPEQRANILIYTLDESEPSLVSFLKTENNLLEASFLPDKYHICTLEQSSDSQGNILVNEILYDVSPLSRLCETAIPIQSELRCYSYDTRREKLALGCCDSSLVIYTQDGKVTHYTKAAFIPSSVSWHNDAYLIFVAGDRGQYQIFDIALSPLLLLDNSSSSTPSITKELVPCASIDHLSWAPLQPSSTDSYLLIRFELGTLVVLRLAVGHMGLLELIKFYLVEDHVSEAVKALKSVYWDSDICLYCMYEIYNALIQRHHTDDIEYHLEHLLAIYFVPNIPLGERIRRKHAKSMRILARRFFMWLLRAKKYPRALQIAISLGEDGLFYKLSVICRAIGDDKTATEAASRITRREVSSSSSTETRCSSSEHSHSHTCSCGSTTEISDIEPEHEESLKITIPRHETMVLQPPSPYANPPLLNPSVPPVIVKSENEKRAANPKHEAKIEVIHFGVV